MNKKIIVIAVVIAGAALLWWWFRPVPIQAPTVEGNDVSAEEVANKDSVNDINSELEASAVGEFDAEFESIDAELNNL